MPIDNYIDTIFAVDGDKTAVPDAADPGGLVSYDQGYPAGYEIPPGDPGSFPIERGKMNQLFNTWTTILQQYQQHGTPPFITSTMNGGSPYSYSKYDRVLLAGVVYTSITDSNTTTPPGANWNSALPSSTIGDLSYSFNPTPGYGKLLLNTDSIGSGLSGATHANAIYSDLYTFLWTYCSFPSSNTVASVTGGLGASAAADFAANKKMTLPNSADFVLIGIGSIITQPGATAGASTVASAGSVATTINSFTLSTAQLSPHDHPINYYGNIPSGGTQTAASSNTFDQAGSTGSAGSGSSITPTASSVLTGSNTSVVQKSMGVYTFINYL